MALDQGVVELFDDLRASLHRWVSSREAQPGGEPSLVAAALDRIRPQTVDHLCDALIQLAHAASTLDEPQDAPTGPQDAPTGPRDAPAEPMTADPPQEPTERRAPSTEHPEQQLRRDA